MIGMEWLLLAGVGVMLCIAVMVAVRPRRLGETPSRGYKPPRWPVGASLA